MFSPCSLSKKKNSSVFSKKKYCYTVILTTMTGSAYFNTSIYYAKEHLCT